MEKSLASNGYEESATLGHPKAVRQECLSGKPQRPVLAMPLKLYAAADDYKTKKASSAKAL